MALSDEEQRLLDQLEESLRAEDPRLARSFSAQDPQTRAARHRSYATGAGLVFIAGVIALISGIGIHWAISTAGFIAMFVATVIAVASWQKVEKTQSPSVRSHIRTPKTTSTLEDRWRRRQEGGL